MSCGSFPKITVDIVILCKNLAYWFPKPGRINSEYVISCKHQHSLPSLLHIVSDDCKTIILERFREENILGCQFLEADKKNKKCKNGGLKIFYDAKK